MTVTTAPSPALPATVLTSAEVRPTALPVDTPASPSPSPAPSPSPPPPAASLTGTVRLISSFPRGGAASERIESLEHAIQMAVQDRGGRVGGAAIDYQALDDGVPGTAEFDAGLLEANAKKASDDADVVAFIGPFSSDAARVAVPILNRAGVLTVSPSASDPYLTRDSAGPDELARLYPTGQRTLIRVAPSDDVQGRAAAKWLSRLGVRTVVVLRDRDRFGGLLAESFRVAALGLGLTVVMGPERAQIDGAELEEQLRWIVTLRPDAVYVAGIADAGVGILLHRLREALGGATRLVGPDGLYDDLLGSEVGAGELLVTVGVIPPSRLPATGQTWRARYVAAHGAEPDAYAAYAYEAASLALDAVERTGTRDRATVRAAAFGLGQRNGPLGTWSVNSVGESSLESVYGIAIRDGRPDPTSGTLIE
ncbi:MAG: branched-chain amino acid ABC transporter substrate-binding protein [Chloroflexota bacterium]